MSLLKSRALFFLCGLLFLSASTTLLAELTWKKTVIDYKAKPSDEKVTAVYYFVNSGNAPEKIIKVQTGCGCTVAKPDKEVYAPGAMGTVKVTFTFGGRTGQQEKTVQILTDDPQSGMSTLTLNVTIPQFLSVEPELVYWKRNEQPMAKVVNIKVLAPQPVEITTIDSSNADFTTELITVKKGWAYQMKVTPKDTKETDGATLRLLTITGKDLERFAIVNAQVY